MKKDINYEGNDLHFKNTLHRSNFNFNKYFLELGP